MSEFTDYCSDWLDVQQLPLSCTPGDAELQGSFPAFDSMFRKSLLLLFSPTATWHK